MWPVGIISQNGRQQIVVTDKNILLSLTDRNYHVIMKSIGNTSDNYGDLICEG